MEINLDNNLSLLFSDQGIVVTADNASIWEIGGVSSVSSLITQ